MKVNGVVLNNHQANFIKELMGDVFMPDTRAEAQLAKLTLKYDVDLAAMLTAANVRFKEKNDALKKAESAIAG